MSNSRVISGEEYADSYGAELISQRGTWVARIGSLDFAGDEDRYVIELTDAGSKTGEPIIVQTAGSLDTVVDLYGINPLGDLSLELTDNDGGPDSNAYVETWSYSGCTASSYAATRELPGTTNSISTCPNSQCRSLHEDAWWPANTLRLFLGVTVYLFPIEGRSPRWRHRCCNPWLLGSDRGGMRRQCRDGPEHAMHALNPDPCESTKGVS